MAAETNPEDYDELMFVIGEAGDLTQYNATAAAFGVLYACSVNTRAKVTISIDGYDDDPRELWEIPEAIQFIQMFVYVMYIKNPTVADNIASRLTEESLKWERTTH
jgi:hypothetical protein